MSKYSPQKSRSKRWRGYLLIIIAICMVLQYLVPLLVLAALGLGIYYYFFRRPQNKIPHSTASPSHQIEQLKADIALADGRIKQLERYQEEKQWEKYQALAQQLLPQLYAIKETADELKQHLSADIYNRIQQKIKQTSSTIQLEIEQLTQEKTTTEQEDTLQNIAPEIADTIQNIQKDHAAILEKIAHSESSNKEELTAIHQSQMEHFNDILAGYLKIKQSPKDFYQADERLEAAKKALEQFDLMLDETLRELNEADLRDFDISLRILNKQQADKI